jgi:hypothetical protein
MTLQNERFEELLSRQLAAELEPQRGRAAAAFQAQLTAEAAEREARRVAGGSKSQVSWARREVSKPAAWMWAGVPSLVAASLAIVLTLQLGRQPTFVGSEVIVQTPANSFVNNSGGNQGGVSGVGMGSLAGYSTERKQGELPLPLPPVPQPYPYRLPE